MPTLETIDIAIGLALLFLFMSLLCTSLREAVEQGMKTRASDLERGVRQLLREDGELVRRLYEHPVIYSLYHGDYRRPDPKALYKRGGELPSYIPSSQFANALVDMVLQGARAYTPYAGAQPALTLENLRAAAEGFPNAHVGKAVLVAIDHADGDLETARKNIESWFDGTMDRVSGWYKRRTQTILFLIGLATAVVLNVDALEVAERLGRDKALRGAIVAQAERAVAAGTPDAAKPVTPEIIKTQLDEIGFPIGWVNGLPGPQPTTIKCQPPAEKAIGAPKASSPSAPKATPTPALPAKPNVPAATASVVRKVWPVACATSPLAIVTDQADGTRRILTPGQILSLVLGWLVSAAAIMLGAPFWFDILNRLMVIRATVKPTEKSPDEPSVDPGKASPAATQAEAPSPSPGAAGSGTTSAPAAPVSTTTPAGFPFIPHRWTDGREEGLL